MHAIILAAGVGSRLLPHTDTLPKCLLTVRGHRILDYQIRALTQCGINNIIVVVGHQGKKIQNHLSIPVTFIENRDYRTTNSSYSLWLARKHLHNGFIYLNSDLIFHPEMLRALLATRHENAIVIDKSGSSSKDMFGAHMDGERILKIDKKLPEHLMAAEAVGPAKFSPAGASRVFDHIEELIAAGEKNRWCYDVFSRIAKDHHFMGIENPGHFWAEIDTPEDLAWATENMPHNFMDKT